MKKPDNFEKKLIGTSPNFKNCFIAMLFFMHYGVFYSKAQYFDDIQLKSQMEVNSLKAKYPNEEILVDNFQIGPSNDITDLSPLTYISIKSNYLIIRENVLLENLNGLEKTDRTARLSLHDNPVLNDVSVFDEILFYSTYRLGSISITNNPKLNTCCFVTKPQYNCASIYIRNNAAGCDSIEQVLKDCTDKNIQSCELKYGFKNDTLQANNVKALINSNGGLFYNYSDRSIYEVPAGSRKNALFMTNLWMGGIGENGDLRVAAQTFGDYGADFWPGPIAENYAHCSEFNRVWNISKTSVDTFLNHYIESSGAITIDEVPNLVLKYPAKNNSHFNDFPLPENVKLAPFIDTNNDGNYNPLDGDYPAIKGDQNYWNVISDLRYYNRDQGCNDPIEMQISCMAYASASDDYIDNATFYDYTFNYLGSDTLKEFYLGLFVLAELGNYSDDFVGCNVEAKMAYVYNGDDFDESADGYGDEIPALGIKFIKSLVNEKGKEADLAAFVTFRKQVGYSIGRPVNSKETYNYLKGLWKDGTPLTFGQYGYGGDVPHPFMYSDPPNDENGWSEYTVNNSPYSRRFVMSVGPVTLTPGEEQTITIGILWQPDIGGGNLDLSPLFEISKQIETDIDSVFALPCKGNIVWYEDLDGNGLGNPLVTKYACEKPTNYVSERDTLATNNQPNTLTVMPNPSSEFIHVSFSNQSSKFHKMTIYNSLGQLIYHNKMLGNKIQLKIDVSGFEAGIYFLKAIDENDSKHQFPFLKQ